MSKLKQSRKDFLRKLGLSIGAAAVAPAVSASFFGYHNDEALNKEQKEFLQGYETWLGDFHCFVKKQKEDFLNTDNNKRLMELSAQAEEWKKQLEVHMLDQRFANYHEKITTHITQEIV